MLKTYSLPSRGEIMRFVSWNVNGLRAALRKGIDTFFLRYDADVIMLQETRSLSSQLPSDWVPEGYHLHLHPAEKKGYSGVATLSRVPQRVVRFGHGGRSDVNDSEGRVLVSEIGECICINTYLPSGSNKDERQAYKETWMEEWRVMLQPYINESKPVIVCGDLNIAHQECDIWNPKGNQQTSGFLPHEREWFTALLGDGWVDAFRHHSGPEVKTYSWWSNRGQAREKDRGWRIDYFLLNPAALLKLKSCSIDRQGGLEISDHAAVILELDY